MILFYDFHESPLGSNNLRDMSDMILSNDSMNRQSHHHISPNHD